MLLGSHKFNLNNLLLISTVNTYTHNIFTMQKRGAVDEELEGENPSKRSRNEQSTDLAVIAQTSSALTVQSDQVFPACK